MRRPMLISRIINELYRRKEIFTLEMHIFMDNASYCSTIASVKINVKWTKVINIHRKDLYGHK